MIDFKKITDRVQARWNANLTSSGLAAQKRTTPITYAEYEQLRGNSWDRVEFIRKLDRDGLRQVAIKYLGHCGRIQEPASSYGDAILATVLPLLLEKLANDSAAVRTVELIDLFRAEPGNVVSICNENEDAEDVDRSQAVEVVSDWTGWVAKRFYGRTVLAALEKAFNDPTRPGNDQMANTSGCQK